MKADRLLAILLLLQAHGPLTAAELSARLEVTRRTIRRDIDALGAAGVPVYAVRGRSGGYALLEGYRPDATRLTGDDARALFLFAGGAAADLGLHGHLDTALRKLIAAVPTQQRDAATSARQSLVVDPAGWDEGRSRPAALDIVRSAVLSGRRLRMTYRSPGASAARSFDVEPSGLVLAAGTSYLVGAAVAGGSHGEPSGAGPGGSSAEGPRTFRVSRVVEAIELEELAQRPPDLDLERLWSELRRDFAAPAGHPMLDVVVRVRPAMLATLERLQGRAIVEIGPGDAAGDWRTVRLRYTRRKRRAEQSSGSATPWRYSNPAGFAPRWRGQRPGSLPCMHASSARLTCRPGPTRNAGEAGVDAARGDRAGAGPSVAGPGPALGTRGHPDRKREGREPEEQLHET